MQLFPQPAGAGALVGGLEVDVPGGRRQVREPSYSLHQLHVFVAVAEYGAISEAARALHLSPSAVSATLTDLEATFGVQLGVRRRAHGVALTRSGTALLERARELLRHAAELEAEAVGTGAELTGPLAVGCYPTLGPTLLTALLGAFEARHPEVSVSFAEDTQDRLQRRLTAGELDLLVVYDLDLSPALVRTAIAHRSPFALVAAEHPIAARGEIELAELADEPMVLLDAPPSSAHALGLCADAGFTPRVRFRTGNFETARALVGRGFGWSLFLQRPAHDLTYDNRPVRPLALRNPAPPDVAIVVAHLRDAVMHPRARAFVRFAASLPDPVPCPPPPPLPHPHP